MPTREEGARDDVAVALAMVLDELQKVRQALNQQGARAFGAGAYDEVERLRREADRLKDFGARVQSLADEWQAPNVARPAPEPTSRTRLPRGVRTPESAFEVPILRALIQLGGAAQAEQVLNAVGKDMESVLSAHDLALLPSKRETRWRNSARWARQSMVEEGLLTVGDRPGVWQITEEGRAHLAEREGA